MTVKVGDKFPAVTLKHLTADGMQELDTGTLFAGKKAVLFAVPGAFTPTCSAKHLPGFLQNADALRQKGVEVVACMAVNDPFVMDAWAKHNNAGDKVVMLPDGSGRLTKELGLELDLTGAGLGQRSKRFAMIIDDGVVKDIAVDESGFEKSSAESVLSRL